MDHQIFETRLVSSALLPSLLIHARVMEGVSSVTDLKPYQRRLLAAEIDKQRNCTFNEPLHVEPGMGCAFPENFKDTPELKDIDITKCRTFKFAVLFENDKDGRDNGDEVYMKNEVAYIPISQISNETLGYLETDVQSWVNDTVVELLDGLDGEK